MSNKGYNVSVIFDLHGISCPGVWLCPKGKILVKVSLFGVSEITKQVNPAFPLRFNERFHFNKSFKSTKTKNELFTRLRNSLIKMQLIQHPPATTETVVLGVFCSPITQVLYPCPNITSDETSADVDLLFCPCKIFPGIIAPKAEVSTKIQIQASDAVPIGSKMNPTTITSKICNKRLTEGEKIIRQRGVCHTKYNYDCKCFLPKCQEIRATKPKTSIRPRKTKEKPKSATITKRLSVNDEDDHSKEPYKSYEDDQIKEPYKCYEEDQGKINDFNKDKDCADIIAQYNKHRQMQDKRYSQLNKYRERNNKSKEPKVCPCCGNEPKVKFRNFTPSPPVPVQVQQEHHERDKENKIYENTEGKESGCAVCNCSICLKYEAYFIHRAIEHKRGTSAPQEFNNVSKKVSSESNLSDEAPPPDLTPNKCFCFKDKKDYNLEKQKRNTEINRRPSSNQRNLQSDYSSEKCNLCQCPLPKDTYASQRPETKQRNVQSDHSSEKCNVCQCPLPTYPITIEKYNPEDQCDQLRDQFYKDLDEYYGQMKNNKDKRRSSKEPKKTNLLKKPSSQLLNKHQNHNWGYKKMNDKGPGYWDINAADWNRLQL